MNKIVATLIATAFITSVFAVETEKKVEAKPAATAPAPAVSAPAKADATKSPAKKDNKKATPTTK